METPRTQRLSCRYVLRLLLMFFPLQISGFVTGMQQPVLHAGAPSSASLRLDVPESPFGVNPLASYSSSYLNELTLSGQIVFTYYE